jgi:hypothetical protein
MPPLQILPRYRPHQWHSPRAPTTRRPSPAFRCPPGTRRVPRPRRLRCKKTSKPIGRNRVGAVNGVAPKGWTMLCAACADCESSSLVLASEGDRVELPPLFRYSAIVDCITGFKLTNWRGACSSVRMLTEDRVALLIVGHSDNSHCYCRITRIN